MKCFTLEPLLSHFWDGELPPEMHRAAELHVQQCADCRRQLDQFRQLSELLASLPEPQPPAMWAQVEKSLSAEKRQSQTTTPTAGRAGQRANWRPGCFGRAWTLRSGSPFRRVLHLAALLLVLAGVSFFARHYAHHRSARAMEAVFMNYLDEFHQDPQAAQQWLLSAYPGRRIAPGTEDGGGASGLAALPVPRGYTVASRYAIEMPCCRCLQTVCRRDDGSWIAIFEHGDQQLLAGRKGECSTAQCSGRTVRTLPLGQELAATWTENGRWVTVVGVSDTDELARLVPAIESASSIASSRT